MLPLRWFQSESESTITVQTVLPWGRSQKACLAHCIRLRRIVLSLHPSPFCVWRGEPCTSAALCKAQRPEQRSGGRLSQFKIRVLRGRPSATP